MRPWIERAAILFTHVVAQITNQWLPPPLFLPLDEAFSASSIEAEAELGARWRAFLRWAALAADDVFPWLADYRRLVDPSLEKALEAVTSHLARTQAAGGGVILYGDAEYPPLLTAISDPPLALSYLGDRTLLARPLIAVIGSRKATRRSLDESFVLGKRLAAEGRVVVSGGALGCDIAAHAGALAVAGTPALAVIVLAGGLARFYPARNDWYFRQLRLRQALFLSERLWLAPSRPRDFPARNRIISGLCQTTVVMQAAQKSGAMITARQALDQGREVSVLRHPPGDVRSSGSANLLADGAVGFADASSYCFY